MPAYQQLQPNLYGGNRSSLPVVRGFEMRPSYGPNAVQKPYDPEEHGYAPGFVGPPSADPTAKGEGPEPRVSGIGSGSITPGYSPEVYGIDTRAPGYESHDPRFSQTPNWVADGPVDPNPSMEQPFGSFYNRSSPAQQQLERDADTHPTSQDVPATAETAEPAFNPGGPISNQRIRSLIRRMGVMPDYIQDQNGNTIPNQNKKHMYDMIDAYNAQGGFQITPDMVSTINQRYMANTGGFRTPRIPTVSGINRMRNSANRQRLLDIMSDPATAMRAFRPDVPSVDINAVVAQKVKEAIEAAAENVKR